MNNLIPQLYIVNDFDRPEDRLLAEKRSDGLLWYVHPEFKDRQGGCSPGAETKVEDFGIEISRPAQSLLAGVMISNSIATYPDGKKRSWQGASSFSFRPYFEEEIPLTDSVFKKMSDIEKIEVDDWKKQKNELGAEIRDLKHNATEHHRLKMELHKIINPHPGRAENPSMCDLVSAARSDRAEMLELLGGAKEFASNTNFDRHDLRCEDRKDLLKRLNAAIKKLKGE